MSTLIIGVSGASSSGKSTLARHLREILPNATILHEDNFYFPDDQIPYDDAIKDQNWDCPGAIDFDKLCKAVEDFKTGTAETTKTKESADDTGAKLRKTVSYEKKQELMHKASTLIGDRRVCLVDGFLMYHTEELMRQFDIKLFMITDYTTLETRRKAREYTIDTGVWIDPPGYFAKCVWPAYYKYHKHLFVNGDDESEVKRTGGTLNSYAEDKLGISGFTNNDNSVMDDIVEEVCESIFKQVKDLA